MDGNSTELKFTCCFCGKTIKSSKTDPAHINVLINFDKIADRQFSQDFFCHVDCFREKLDNKIKMHFHLHNILD